MKILLQNFFIQSFFFLLFFSCQLNPGKLIIEKEGESIYSHVLSSDDVTCFIMGEDKMLWIGTGYGLNLYDGYRYQQFFHTANDSTSIPGDNIRTLFRDSKGTIWIGTGNGLACYTGFAKFRRYDIEHSLNGITQIAESSDGKIWANNGKDVYRLDDDYFHKMYSFDLSAEYIYNNKIHTDKKGGIWLITPSKCWYYDKDSNAGKSFVNKKSGNMVVTTGTNEKIWIAQGRNLFCVDLTTQTIINEAPEALPILPTSMIEDGDNLLLSSGRHGLYTFDTKTHELHLMPEEDFPLRKNHTQISCFYNDDTNNLWIGYRNGGFQALSQSDRKIIPISRNALKLNTLNKKVSVVARSTDNLIWGATDLDIFCYNPETDKLTLFKQNDIFTDSPYFQQTLKKIIATGHTIWLLTNVRIVKCSFHNGRLNVENSINIGPVLGDMLSVSNTNYIVTDNRYMYMENKNNNRLDSIRIDHPFYNAKSKLLQLSSGNILLCMENRHLMLVNPYTNEIHPVHLENESFKSGFIPTVAIEDAGGRIWLGSKGHGLFRLDLPGNRIEEIHSLPSLQIMSIQEDIEGSLWIGTRKGVIKYLPEKDRSYLYAMRIKEEDEYGMFAEQSSCTYPGDMILFGGDNGCIIIPPLLMQQDADPYLSIRKIRIRKEGGDNGVVNTQISDDSHFTFTYNERDIEINFGGITYGDVPLYMYEYKMEGFDHSWNYAGIDLHAPYSNLPPGNYTFRVRAMQALHSQIMEEKSCMITVLPSPWLSKPAIICYILLLILLIWYINHLYLRIRSNQMALEVASREKERELRTNQMNMSFFANISHEFRNPLTMIAGPVTSLRNDTSLPSGARRKLGVISQSVNQLLRLVDQMLDFNQLEQDVLKLKVAVYDIVYEMNSWAGIFQVTAQERNIELQKEGLDNSCFTWLDIDKLYKILSNLFTNALKHTPDNGIIRLTFRMLNYEEASREFECTPSIQSEYLYISVYNSGKQIPENKLTKVFKRYYQVEETKESHNHGWGTGIGLYYVQRLVQLHHGYIRAENKEDGVVFGFIIPMGEKGYEKNEHIEKEKALYMLPHESPAVSGPVEKSQEEENARAHKPKLLIVDDEIEMARYLKSLFKDDYQIINKYNVESALEELKQTMPDVILSDVIMGELSGYDFCKAMKNDLAYSHIPFILITAKSKTDEQIEGLDLGANAYVTKPFDPGYLQALVRSQLKNSENMRKLLNESTTIPPEGELSPQDKAFMNELYTLMEKHLSDLELNVGTICDSLHISRSKFNYKMKGMTGDTPNNFFKKYKLNRAAKLLREGKYNVSEVALMTGFGTVSHFSVSFKKHFGMNPSDYK